MSRSSYAAALQINGGHYLGIAHTLISVSLRVLHCNVFFNGEVDLAHADMIRKQLGSVMMFLDGIIDGGCFPEDLYEDFETMSIVDRIDLYSDFDDTEVEM